MNGTVLFHETTPPNGSYPIIDHLWLNNDVLSFKLPMKLSTNTWTVNHNAGSISYGPIIFSLDINEQYNRIGGVDEWSEYEVIPKSN